MLSTNKKNEEVILDIIDSLVSTNDTKKILKVNELKSEINYLELKLR